MWLFPYLTYRDDRRDRRGRSGRWRLVDEVRSQLWCSLDLARRRRCSPAWLHLRRRDTVSAQCCWRYPTCLRAPARSRPPSGRTSSTSTPTCTTTAPWSPCPPTSTRCSAASARRSTRIDLRDHAGVHPRVGAVDVAPIVFTQPEERGDAVAHGARPGRRDRPPRRARAPLRALRPQARRGAQGPRHVRLRPAGRPPDRRAHARHRPPAADRLQRLRRHVARARQGDRRRRCAGCPGSWPSASRSATASR